MVKRATLDSDQRRAVFDSIFSTVSQLLVMPDAKRVCVYEPSLFVYTLHMSLCLFIGLIENRLCIALLYQLLCVV